MSSIEAVFAEYFGNWDIRLPPDAISLKQPGKIMKSGWIIRYVFGDGYLDFYAVHRMTNPRHVRIHSDGRCEWLEAAKDWYSYPGDADESTRRQAEEEYYAYNKRVYSELRAKGLAD